MPVTVGIDLTSVETVREAIAEHSNRYLERVYTEQEVADSTRPAGVAPELLATRFAAKEAAIKALRLPPNAAVPWRDIEVRKDASGSLCLTLAGRVATLAEEAGPVSLALSVTYEQGLASAVVVASSR